MSATRIAFAAITLFFLSACTIHLSPKSFVYQDEQREELDLAGLEAALMSKNRKVNITALSLERENGLVLRGYTLQQPHAKANIVFYPGNAMKINFSFEVAKRLARIPANIVWFEYRGVGISDSFKGDVTIEHLRQDSQVVFDLAKNTLPEELPLLVHGLSLGSLLAVDLVNERTVDALVLDSAIASVLELSDRLTPWWARLFASVVLDDELQSLQMAEIIKQYSGPLLVVVGELDGMTPESDARQLYQNASGVNRTLLVAPKVGHAKPLRTDEVLQAYSKLIDSL